MTVLDRLAEAIDSLHPRGRILVDVDGPDAAVKTTLEDQVVHLVQRPVLRASVDDWHLPRGERIRRGALSAEGCYRDTFDYPALRAQLLAPFAAGAAHVVPAAFDYRTDQPIDARAVSVAPAAALLLDGVFLQRPELRARWDLVVYLHVPAATTMARALSRDVSPTNAADDVRRRYEQRHLPAQAIYRAEAAPMDNADIVLDNTDPEAPRVLKWRTQVGSASGRARVR